MTTGNSSLPAGFQAVEATVFDNPSGNVRGTVTACVPNRQGTPVRIAHAFLTTEAPAKVSIDINEKFGAGDLALALQVLQEFLATVRRLDLQA